LATPKARTKSKTDLRRPPARARHDVLIMPIVVGGAFALVFIGIIVAILLNRSPATGPTVANIRCDTGEQLAVHYHAHVDLIYKGQPAAIPAQVGITGSCFYWMHTHQNTGIVHIEAPRDSATRQFTLGDFFQIWGQPLSKTQVATFPKLGPGDQLKIWVDGKPFTADPRNIVLKSHTQVVVEIGPTFVWTSSAATQEAGTAG
jgi:hypothetical protein